MSRKLIVLFLAVAAVAAASVVFNHAFGTPRAVAALNRSIAGLPPAPEGKVTQYVVNCGDLPGKCPAVLSMTPIYTDVSELGFQLTDPESIRQFDAAVQIQKQNLSDMRNSGQLSEIQRRALSAYTEAVLSGGLEAGEEAARARIQSYRKARADLGLTDGMTSAPSTVTTDSPFLLEDPGGECTFGSPCPGGLCGTIIDSDTSFARCTAACIDCRRI
jgi:hypothetical protein